MSLTRTFIDWSRPLIPAVVEDLFDRYAVLGVADLRQVVIAFPTRHGLKRFDDLWARKTGGAGHPPRRITVGELPELLYKPLRPFASDLVQKLAWGEAVRGLPKNKVERVLGHLPDEADFYAWLTVGELLWRTHIELAADGLDFGDVAARGAELAGFREGPRWQAMREMQQSYLATLDGLQMWDQQTARLVAIERGECRTANDIILVGASDLNIALRQMLDQVADRVTAYVHAPQELSERFDAHGCLIPAAWEHADVDFREEQIALADSPADQAREVVRRLRDLKGSRRIDEITVGVPDERMVPVLRRVLGEFGVASHRAIETTLQETGPFRLLAAVSAWLEGQRPSQFAELVRHPAISGWLGDQGVPSRWLMELDEFQTKHLQRRLGNWPEGADRISALQRAWDLVTALLTGLAAEARLLGEWTKPVTDFLLSAYGYHRFDMEDPDDRRTVESCRRIVEAFQENIAVPELVMPSVTAYQAIKLTLNSIRDQSMPADSPAAGVDLLGWLDLAQDDNPIVVLTNFNEHYIPSSLNSDLFLPNALRQHLGLTDNQRRYARDIHALMALLASRDNVSLIVGRRDVRQEPLIPSRLMFATDGATIAERIKRFYGRDAEQPEEPAEERQLEILTERTLSARHRFEIPSPDPESEIVERLRVTAFRNYLTCPYRFYLRHVLRLEEVEEDDLELSPRGFGTFIHEVLAEFGRHPAANSADAATTLDALLKTMEATANRWFGNDPLPVVRIQIEQIERRLRAFAVWQTLQAQEGWVIQCVEQDYEMDFGRTRKIRVTGRIDRIDRHPRTNTFRILDYKTGETAKKPEAVHRRSKSSWIDLQLPLYRRLASAQGIEGDPLLGYVNLSKETDEPMLAMAEWTDDELHQAESVALDIVDRVLARDFGPMSEKPVSEAREFARICQEGVFGREVPR
jgi:RecB family exonuclease